MKKKTIELDVDFIGGQGSLTKDEERQISEFIKTQKLIRDKQKIRSAKSSVHKNVTV